MELKVWCDGIQRVVCGVSATTTCQDVVFALAHATGQTGRFVLIEKWRHNERLLSPGEQPMAVLSSWGEYANDVVFVMKRSHSSRAHANNASPSAASPSRRDGLKKTLAFSLSGSSLPKPVSSALSSALSNGNALSTTPTIAASSMASSTKPTSTPTTSQHTAGKKAESNANTATTPTKLKPHSQTAIANNYSSINASEIYASTKSLASRPRHPPPYEEAISKSALITNSTPSHSIRAQSMLEERNNKRRSIEPSPQSQKQRTNSQKEQLIHSSHRDALKHMDAQKETMKSQEKDKLSLEQQLTTMERKLMENEIIIKRYKDEMSAVHQLWLDQEAIITKLDQQKLEEEREIHAVESKTYDEEVIDLKKKLSNCEGDIADCRQKIAKLMDKLEDTDKMAKIDEMDRIKREESDRLLTDQMKIAIRDKTREYESQKCDLQALNNSISQLDSILQEKRSQVDRLTCDVKEANIQGLALQPADDTTKLTQQPFQQRSGSTRRMIGSPRQLENAVATNKNPHGVWV